MKVTYLEGKCDVNSRKLGWKEVVMLIVVKTLFAKVMKTNDPVTTLLELILGSWYRGTPEWSIKCLSNTATGGVLWPGNRLGRPNYVPLSQLWFQGHHAGRQKLAIMGN